MGIWDYISSTSSSVVQNAPDLTAVKGWDWGLYYGYSRAAVAKVDDAVRTKVIQSMKDEETRSNIVRIATNFAKSGTVLACEEVLKVIPGGSTFYKIFSQSLHNEKKSGCNEVETKALQARMSKMEEEITELKKLTGQEEIQKPFADFKPENNTSFESNVDRKPEDVIRVFMMKESIGRQFFDDLIVPTVRITRKNSK